MTEIFKTNNMKNLGLKTACIYHSVDLDGWMSAAIVKHWFLNDRDGISSEYQIISVEENNCVFKTINGQQYSLNLIGYNYGEPIPDLLGYDKIIMCDVSFPKEEMERIANKLTWIDHHISAINMMNESESFKSEVEQRFTQTNFSACELTWMYFFPNENMPEIIRLLGRYDCFGHKGTEEEKKVLEFQYGARQCISNYEEAYGYLIQCTRTRESEYWFLQAQVVVGSILEQGKAIYKFLCTEARQTFDKAYQIKMLTETQGWVNLCVVNKERFNPINFEIDYHEKGYHAFVCYWYDGNSWKFSVYNDNGSFDCSKFAQSFDGGGHKGAAGFISDSIKDWERK